MGKIFESNFHLPVAVGRALYDSKSADLAQSNDSTDDVIYKFNLTYDVNDNLLTFFNYAEGFVPVEATRLEQLIRTCPSYISPTY